MRSLKVASDVRDSRVRRVLIYKAVRQKQGETKVANAKKKESKKETEAEKAMRWGETLRIIGDVLGVDYNDHDAVIAAFKTRVGVKYIAGIDKIPEDVFEDDVAHSLVQSPKHLAQEKDRVGAVPVPVSGNPIGELLELCTQRHWPQPTFLFGQAIGPSHAPTFTCRAALDIKNTPACEEKASTKQEAKKRAAAMLLERVR